MEYTFDDLLSDLKYCTEMLFLKVSAENRGDCQQKLQRLVEHILYPKQIESDTQSVSMVTITLNQNCWHNNSRNEGEYAW